MNIWNNHTSEIPGTKIIQKDEKEEGNRERIKYVIFAQRKN